MSASNALQSRSLAQRLAVMTQIHLPGTVGRILKQNRDLEAVAPLFKLSGLVKYFKVPNPLNLRVSAIATGVSSRPIWGGLVYAAAAVRTDLAVEDNVMRTIGEDSACDVDDMDYEDQWKRLQLIGVRQGYEMASAALRSSERPELILMDTPLVLNRSMVPTGEAAQNAGYLRVFESAMETIRRFWKENKELLFPWNPEGSAVVSLASERFGAIVYVAQQDLRTAEGRRHLLGTEHVDSTALQEISSSQSAISGVGARRFLNGILERQTRTVAFRMNVSTPRMEPTEVASEGVVGFHVRTVNENTPQLVQLIGESPEWSAEKLDELAGAITALTVSNGNQPIPIPLFLAQDVVRQIPRFLEDFRGRVEDQMRKRQLESDWLTGLDSFQPESE